MRKLRLLVTADCPRHCSRCCNKSYNVHTLPAIGITLNDLEPYGEIIITGGEPLMTAKMDKLKALLTAIRLANPDALVYLYTSMISKVDQITDLVDGVTLTIHSEWDAGLFEGDMYYGRLGMAVKAGREKSFRLNVFNDIRQMEQQAIRGWKVRKIKWIDDCPIPEGEDFMRLTNLI